MNRIDKVKPLVSNLTENIKSKLRGGNAMYRIITAALACCFVAGISVKPANATLITYNVSVASITGGPFDGQSLTGSFSFDDSIIPAGGTGDVVFVVLPDLLVQFGTLTFDETSAGAAALNFLGGTLTSFLIGGNANGPNQLGDHIDDFLLSPHVFIYTTSAGDIGHDTSPGGISFSLAQVPEPGTLALLGVGLLGLLARRGRSKLWPSAVIG